MITIREFDKKKGINNIDIKSWNAKQFSWVDCYKPTSKELEILAEKTGLGLDKLKERVSSNKRPHLLSAKDHAFILLIGTYTEKGEIKTAPISIFLYKNFILTIHNKPIAGLEALRNLPDDEKEKMFQRGVAYLFLKFLNAAFEDYYNLIPKIGEDIEKLEQEVVEKPSKRIAENAFKLKHTLIYWEKSLVANKEVLGWLEHEPLKSFIKDDHLIFQELRRDAAELIDIVSVYLEILTNVVDLYLNAVNNNLNQVMKTLTGLSALVLIPTLITGIYGMNFQPTSTMNMPELYWRYGYFFSLGLIIISIVSVYVWFKKRDWV